MPSCFGHESVHLEKAAGGEVDSLGEDFVGCAENNNGSPMSELLPVVTPLFGDQVYQSLPLLNCFFFAAAAPASQGISLDVQPKYLHLPAYCYSRYYGGTLAEKVLGKALKTIPLPREKYVVSSKCGRYMDGFDFSADRVTKSIDETLERLNLSYIDIMQCHDIEFGSLDQVIAETIPALLKLKASGKIRFIGITGLPLKIFKYVLDRVPEGTIDVVLSYCHYSLNDSTLQDLLPYLKSKGVGIISASPLSMGLLTESGPPAWHPASKELQSACAAAAIHCKEKGKNISKLALQFALDNQDISTTLVGMNSVEQVRENVRAAIEVENGQSTELDIIEEVKSILEPVKNHCWPSGREENN